MPDLKIVTRKRARKIARGSRGTARPTVAQKAFLRRGRGQPGGKLPLFDEFGQHYNGRTIRSCIAQGWAEPWFDNPINPNWLVCKLTTAGHAVLAEDDETSGPAAPRPRGWRVAGERSSRQPVKLRLVANADWD